MNTQNCIDTCNRLLRGERSAVETYDKAIQKYGHEPIADALSQIRDEHTSSVALLEENVRSMGGQPDLESGAWGAFANTIQAAANLFGQNSAMEALQAGEKSGERDYESALNDEDVMPECKELIRSRLLPTVQAHVFTLENLQSAEK